MHPHLAIVGRYGKHHQMVSAPEGSNIAPCPPFVAKQAAKKCLDGRTAVVACDPFSGTGVISLALATESRGRVKRLLISDVSEQALALTRKNVEAHPDLGTISCDFQLFNALDVKGALPFSQGADLILTDPPHGNKCRWRLPDGRFDEPHSEHQEQRIIAVAISLRRLLNDNGVLAFLFPLGREASYPSALRCFYEKPTSFSIVAQGSLEHSRRLVQYRARSLRH